jgi:hypothetical protein
MSIASKEIIFLAIICGVFLISEKIDVTMSGSFGYKETIATEAKIRLQDNKKGCMILKAVGNRQ